MTAEGKGKLIIRGIPNDDVAQKVVAFMCASAKNATPEAVAARLKNLPLVVSSAIQAQTAYRVVRALQAIGADVEFVPDAPADTSFELESNAVTPPAQFTPPYTTARETARPITPAAVGVVERPAPPDPRAQREARKRQNELREVALAQKLLIYAVVAGFVPAASPVLYFITAPFQLYTIYRLTAALNCEMLHRVLYLLCTLVPLVGIVILLILNAKATRRLTAERIPVGLFGAGSGEIAALGDGEGGGTMIGPVYFLVLAMLAIGGVASGTLPRSWPTAEENVQAMIDREVARANKEFPKEIDPETRIDNVTAGPDKLITINYTMLKHPASEIDADRFGGELKDKVRQETCTDGKLEPLLKKGVSVAYAFNGNDGLPITTITIAPADCGN